MRQKLLSTIIVTLFSLGVIAQPSGWQYNMPITITNGSNAGFSNYIMPVVINTGVLIAANQMQPNGADVRFGTPCTGTKNFSYFIDSGINTAATLFYVKIDTLAPGSVTTIYMFYGNPNVAPISNISILSGPKTLDSGQTVYGPWGISSSNYSFGTRFVPNKDLFVTSLGKNAYSTGNYSVKLWDGSGNLLVQSYVPGVSNSFQYSDLNSPILLKAGNTYTVSIFTGGVSPVNERYFYPSFFVSDANFIGCYYSNTGDVYPSSYYTSDAVGVPDLKYYYAKSVANPPTYVVGTPNSGGVFVQPAPSSICTGGVASFSVFSPAVNQSHFWQVLQGTNWVNIGSTSPYSGSHTATLLINGVSPSMSGNQYRDSVSNSCGSGVSNPATLTVVTPTAFVTPIASISGPNPACDNVNSLYTITTNVVGGSYQWMLNNTVVDTHSVYAFHPNNGDQLYALVTAPNNGNLGCYSLPTAVSNLYSLTTGTNFLPYVTVASNVTNVCDGTQINFHTTSNVYGGSYQWQVNGVNVGINNPGYAYAPANGDQVTCTVFPPANGCYSLPSASSLPIAVTTIPNITPTINLNCPATASSGAHVPVSITILNLTVNYYVLWYKNGVRFDSTNGPTSSFVKGAGVDMIKAVIHPISNESIGACYSTATSNIVNISSTTGISNVQGAKPISVSPNPFKEQIMVNGLEAGDKACLYDVTGRQVTEVWNITNNDDQQKFDIRNVMPGTYFLRILNGDGNSRAVVTLQKL